MSMKDNDYICPHCKGHLNVGGNLVFATRTKRKHKGLIMMSPKVGDYSYLHHDKFQLEQGEMLDFECPICQADLSSVENEGHAMIYMVGAEDNFEFELYFSRTTGKGNTYLVAHEGVETYGNKGEVLEECIFIV